MDGLAPRAGARASETTCSDGCESLRGPSWGRGWTRLDAPVLFQVDLQYFCCVWGEVGGTRSHMEGRRVVCLVPSWMMITPPRSWRAARYVVCDCWYHLLYLLWDGDPRTVRRTPSEDPSAVLAAWPPSPARSIYTGRTLLGAGLGVGGARHVRRCRLELPSPLGAQRRLPRRLHRAASLVSIVPKAHRAARGLEASRRAASIHTLRRRSQKQIGTKMYEPHFKVRFPSTTFYHQVRTLVHLSNYSV